MPTLQEIANAFQNAGGDPEAATVLVRMFRDTAKGMDPTEVSVLRSKNDAVGQMLYGLAQVPVKGESADDRAARLYGPPLPKVGMGEGLARATLGGITVGLGDEVMGGARALFDRDAGGTFGQRYDTAVANERDKAERFGRDHPYIATGTEIAASIPSFVVGGLGLGAAKGLMAGTRAVSAAARAFPRTARVAASPLTGVVAENTVLGGLQGFNEGTGGVIDRAENAVLPAAISGVLGPIANVVGAGAGAWKAGTEARRLGQDVGLSQAASDFLRRLLQSDDALTEGAGRMAAAGSGAMLADTGRSARGALDAIVQSGGPGAKIVREAVDARATQAGRDITTALDTELGAVGGTTSRTVATLDLPTGKAVMDDLYGKAYAAPIDYTSKAGRDIELLMEAVPPEAIDAANALMRVERVNSAQMMATVADDGATVFKTLPDVRQIDYITQGLQEVAARANTAGALGGPTRQARGLGILATDLRTAARTAVPEYDTALKAARNLITEKKAADFGEAMLNPSVKRADVADEIVNWGDESRRAAVDSVRQKIDDVLATVTRTIQDPNTESREAVAMLRNLSSRAVREKVAALIGDDAARSMFAEIDRAAGAIDLKGSLADNSKTFARTNLSDSMKSLTEGGLVNAVKSGEVLSLGRSGMLARLLQNMTGYTDAARLAATDKMQAELATALTGPRGLEILRTLQVGAGRPEAARAATQASVTARARALAAALASPGAEQTRDFLSPPTQPR